MLGLQGDGVNGDPTREMLGCRRLAELEGAWGCSWGRNSQVVQHHIWTGRLEQLRGTPRQDLRAEWGSGGMKFGVKGFARLRGKRKHIGKMP